MSDPLYTDSNVRRTFSNEYSRLLFPVCGGHALWAPRLTDSGGGALGDVGMIVDGAFYKTFNAFEPDDEDNTSPLALPTRHVHRDQAYNAMIMSSSSDSSIEFHITGSAELVGLPLTTLNVQPRVTLSRAKDGLAFLAPPVPTRWDCLDPSLRLQLGMWLATQCQAKPELEGQVIVTDVVRSSGYVGGLILSRNTEVSANLSLSGAGTANAGASFGQHRSLNALLRGPDTWTPNMPAEYSIILKFTTAVTRPGFLRRVGLKLGLSRSSSSPQAHGASTSTTSSAIGPGLQGNTQVAAPTETAREETQEDVENDSAFNVHDICDPSPLTPFLDMILCQHTEIDIAFGDLSILSDFIARYSVEPLPDLSLVKCTIRVQEVEGNTVIAHLESIDPQHASPSTSPGDVTNGVPLSEQLVDPFRLDPFSRFPREVSLKVLLHLDAISLGLAAQVNLHWRSLADENMLWKIIWEQQCLKCSWGLPVPLLAERCPAPAKNGTPRPPMPLSPAASSSSLTCNSLKRARHDEEIENDERDHPAKRPKLDSSSSSPMSVPPIHPSPASSASGRSGALSPPSVSTEQPWKNLYYERLTIARNWRRGRYNVRTFKGHSDSVMCLQFSETMPSLNYPVLITGSYDRTVRVWNVDAGEEVRCLRGHTRAVRALQFDEAKLVTGSIDGTLRVWDWRTGCCIRTLEGHSEGVLCLNFDSNVLASGSVDMTVKVWNFHTECFTLHGHKDWVNAVQLWQLPGTEVSSSVSSATHGISDIDPGKMLFSASDDHTIRLWDLYRKTCVRQFVGHGGQVQTLLLLNMADCPPAHENNACGQHPSGAVQVALRVASGEDNLALPGTRLPHLISGSVDNTIKTWDIQNGLATQTLCGNTEGVWSVVGDNLRLVSGSHDKTIKVWQRGDSAPSLNLVGHEGPVTCLQLSNDKIISGSDDHTIKVWSFSM